MALPNAPPLSCMVVKMCREKLFAQQGLVCNPPKRRPMVEETGAKVEGQIAT
jgi:hypothetical protein